MSAIKNLTASEQNHNIYSKEKMNKNNGSDFQLSAGDGTQPTVNGGKETGNIHTQPSKTEALSKQDLYTAQCRMSRHCRQIPNGLTPETAIGIGILELDNTGNRELHIYETGEFACVDVQNRKDIWKLYLSESQLKKVHELSSSFGKEFSLLGHDAEFWKFYVDSGKDTQDFLDVLQRTDDKTLHAAILGQAPPEVKAAWETAAGQSGTNGFGFVSGQFTYLSELGKKYLEAALDGKEMDFLGNSTESVLSFARGALDSLNKSLEMQNTDRIRLLKSKEKDFYEKLINLLTS